jgi:hypothetical protein
MVIALFMENILREPRMSDQIDVSGSAGRVAGGESFFPNLYIHCELCFFPNQNRNPGPNRNLTLGPNPNPNPNLALPLTLYLLRSIFFAMGVLVRKKNWDILVRKKKWRLGG